MQVLKAELHNLSLYEYCIVTSGCTCDALQQRMPKPAWLHKAITGYVQGEHMIAAQTLHLMQLEAERKVMRTHFEVVKRIFDVDVRFILHLW